MYRMMIVEDDMGIAAAIQKHASMWDFEVWIIEDFRTVMQQFTAFNPHIVLLDITLPCFSGYHWCTEIRSLSKVPIIFISSASDNMNILMAMNAGADDFIAKPFDLNILIAKVRALLRRTYDFSVTAPFLEHRGTILNTDRQSLSFGRQEIPLSKNEYRILLCLLENKGKVVSREKLMERLWATDVFIDENTLTVNVNRLRKKLENAGLTDFITTKFGVGYMIESA